jgi:hypothetical protein
LKGEQGTYILSGPLFCSVGFLEKYHVFEPVMENGLQSHFVINLASFSIFAILPVLLQLPLFSATK